MATELLLNFPGQSRPQHYHHRVRAPERSNPLTDLNFNNLRHGRYHPNTSSFSANTTVKSFKWLAEVRNRRRLTEGGGSCTADES